MFVGARGTNKNSQCSHANAGKRCEGRISIASKARLSLPNFGVPYTMVSAHHTIFSRACGDCAKFSAALFPISTFLLIQLHKKLVH